MIRSYCEAGFHGKAYELLVKMQESDVILYKTFFYNQSLSVMFYMVHPQFHFIKFNQMKNMVLIQVYSIIMLW